MKEITLNQFLNGYEQGYITDLVAIGTRVYGKDPRGMADTDKIFDIVWTEVI